MLACICAPFALLRENVRRWTFWSVLAALAAGAMAFALVLGALHGLAFRLAARRLDLLASRCVASIAACLAGSAVLIAVLDELSADTICVFAPGAGG
ncbi:MAG: hypothetical protein U0166_05475 [Acidobacteriota bacterium]